MAQIQGKKFLIEDLENKPGSAAETVPINLHESWVETGGQAQDHDACASIKSMKRLNR